MTEVAKHACDPKVVERFCSELLCSLPSIAKLSSILLWGSHARGQQIAESDIDIILVLREELRCGQPTLLETFSKFSTVSSCSTTYDFPGLALKGATSFGEFDVRFHVLGDIKNGCFKARKDTCIDYQAHTFLQSAKDSIVLWERACEGQRVLTEVARAPIPKVCEAMIVEGLNYPSLSELARLDRRCEYIARAVFIARLAFCTASAFFGIAGQFGYFRMKGLVRQTRNLQLPPTVRSAFHVLAENPFARAEEIVKVLLTIINYVSSNSHSMKVHQIAERALTTLQP
ncbi:hypothetical protein [Trinickia sp. EG282A]|uniref:hypothetical protein n=1 Tax=Trinickia sp. EG282A TaxID=3237013 RepID=UPI0034D2C6E4